MQQPLQQMMTHVHLQRMVPDLIMPLKLQLLMLLEEMIISFNGMTDGMKILLTGQLHLHLHQLGEKFAVMH